MLVARGGMACYVAVRFFAIGTFATKKSQGYTLLFVNARDDIVCWRVQDKILGKTNVLYFQHNASETKQ
jgi:hypothetical protein